MRPGIAGFARNAITFVYTPQSKYAGEITPANWYQMLARPGVEIGRSNPDTDPSGYQTVQMLSLAENYLHVPDLAAAILANAPRRTCATPRPCCISALQLGQIDYLAIYRSDALQHHFKFLDLPADRSRRSPIGVALWPGRRAHQERRPHRPPIVYAVTIPRKAAHPDWAEKYVAFLLGPEGQAVMQQNGFARLDPAYAVIPSHVRRRSRRW